MNKSVKVAYPFGGETDVNVLYMVELSEDMHIVNCSVEGRSLPHWLQLRKFSFFSQLAKGVYTSLFNEVNNSRNIDTSLFIDEVYKRITIEENMKMA